MSSHSRAKQSLLRIENLSNEQAKSVIQVAIDLKSGVKKAPALASQKILALAFFEPSTRTRLSFEVAAYRLGVKVIHFTPDLNTSTGKGESFAESLATIMAMQPDVIVCRHSGDKNIQILLQNSLVPVINAGDGREEHPTQALLDAMTIIEGRGQIEGEKILFVGDIEHSRVANSGLALFEKLGAEVAYCAPAEFAPKSVGWAKAKKFSSLTEATRWCTVCIGLRIQTERHDHSKKHEVDHLQFRLDHKNLINLSSQALIMHPGPFVEGVDLAVEILSDKRCKIREQVTNGVYVRMAVLGGQLGLFNT